MKHAVIVGAGSGLSASLTRALSAKGYDVALAARNVEKLKDLTSETGARAFACEATSADSVRALFEQLDDGTLDLEHIRREIKRPFLARHEYPLRRRRDEQGQHLILHPFERPPACLSIAIPFLRSAGEEDIRPLHAINQRHEGRTDEVRKAQRVGPVACLNLQIV